MKPSATCELLAESPFSPATYADALGHPSETGNSIELFTGAGGLALGTALAGFRHLAVVERDRHSCATLRLNAARSRHTGVNWDVVEQDVATFDYAPYRGLDLLAGGAPCQPFSLGGKHAGQADARNMFPQVFRAVRETQPKAILLENVRGLVTVSSLPYFRYIIAQLSQPFELPGPDDTWVQHAARLFARKTQLVEGTCSYVVRWRLYNVADFGIPQQRFRVFIVGFRRDLCVQWGFPEPMHSSDALLYSQYVDGSYWDEHGLTPSPVPEPLRPKVSRLSRLPKPMAARWRTVRDALRGLPEPSNNQTASPWHDHVGIPDARQYPGHTGSPLDWPSKALKAGDHGNPGGENMLCRDDGTVRYFTVREMARLQTFPDYWHFAASWTESRRQLGNAVPVEMGRLLGEEIRRQLDPVPEPNQQKNLAEYARGA